MRAVNLLYATLFYALVLGGLYGTRDVVPDGKAIDQAAKTKFPSGGK